MVTLISLKGIAKDLINACSIVIGAKYFVKVASLNYLIFQPALKYFHMFTVLIMFLNWNLKNFQNEVIKF